MHTLLKMHGEQGANHRLFHFTSSIVYFSPIRSVRTTSTHNIRPMSFSAKWNFCVWFVLDCSLSNACRLPTAVAINWTYKYIHVNKHSACTRPAELVYVCVRWMWRYVHDVYGVRPRPSSSRWFSNCLKWMWTINKYPRTFAYVLLWLLWPVNAKGDSMHAWRRDESIRFVLLWTRTKKIIHAFGK